MDPKEFIDKLKRDKARGIIAPHQIVLLIALLNIYEQKGSSIFNIEEINFEFQKVWKEHSTKFNSNNNLVGMPLKALYNQGYITIEILNNIRDFRKLSNLIDNINVITLENDLLELFTFENIRSSLIYRLSH